MKLDTKNNRRDRNLSRVVRELVGAKDKHPIIDVDGFSAPTLQENTKATVLTWRSRQAIVVGRGWLIAQGLV